MPKFRLQLTQLVRQTTVVEIDAPTPAMAVSTAGTAWDHGEFTGPWTNAGAPIGVVYCLRTSFFFIFRSLSSLRTWAGS